MKVGRSVFAGIAVAAALAGGTSAALAAPTPDSGPVAGGTVVHVEVPRYEVTSLAFSGLNPGFAHVSLGADLAWGPNVRGERGDGGTDLSSVPTEVVNAPPGVTYVSYSTGDALTLAVGSDGNAYAWGNYGGGLGDGSSTMSTTPVRVALPAGVTAASVHNGTPYGTNFVLGTDGIAYGWGYNFGGGVGDGTTDPRETPVAVHMPAGVTFTSLSQGHNHTLALGSDGKVYGWGESFSGELGTPGTSEMVPIEIPMPAGVVIEQVQAGFGFSLARAADGTVYGWGDNFTGALGDETTTSRATPAPVHLPAGVAAVSLSARYAHAAALGSDGNVYVWGQGSQGQLGNGVPGPSSTPIVFPIPAGAQAVQVVASVATTVLTDDGRIWSAGPNLQGQLGDGTTLNSFVPVPMVLPQPASVLTGVTFDGVPGIVGSEIAPGVWEVTTPAHAAGPVDVALEWTSGGQAQDDIVFAGGFTYLGPPVITDPAHVSVVEGGVATFTVSVQGAADVAVTWQVSTDGGTTWVPVGAIGTVSGDGLTLTVAADPDWNGYLFQATATDANGSTTSASATLVVTAASGPDGSGDPAGPGAPAGTPSASGGGGASALAATGGAELGGALALGAGAVALGAILALRRRVTRTSR